MKIGKFILILFLINASCEKKVEAEEAETKTATVKFSNGIELNVEVAETVGERAKGLMFRKNLPENHGMLFVFQHEEWLSFWMKDTYIPLSIAFFDKSKKLINIEKMEAQSMAAASQDLRSYRSKKPGLFAIEVNQGWFEKNKIKPGESFEIAKPKSQKAK